MEFDKEHKLLLPNVESEKIELFFECHDLSNFDIVSTTDSFLKVYLKLSEQKKQLILTTKIYWNDLNPVYSETAIIDYFFETRQHIIVEVYHEASPPKLMGTAKTSIGEIVGCRSEGLTTDIMNKQKDSQGKLRIKCEKKGRGLTHLLEFSLNAHDLPSSCFLFCGSDKPFFKLWKVKDGNKYLVYQSEQQEGTSPQFKPTKIHERKLCNDNDAQKILLNLYNPNYMTVPTEIGSAEFTIGQLNSKTVKNFILYDQKRNKKGYVEFKNLKRSQVYGFIDFLSAGMEMALVVCIDFTKSNGDPTNPKSLHHSTANKKSPYEQALRETCSIVMDYDADKLVPTYGFGAQVNMPNLNSQGQIHYCFPLNGNPLDPNLIHVNGIMKGYKDCMKYLKFSGPTYFAPLLRESMLACEDMKKAQKQYMILLILTDGAIHDIKEVKDLLVECSRLPLSIIIVGIGDHGEWKLMHELDDDDMQMTSTKGKKTERDLVQFVEFSKHNNNGILLAEKVLEELPRQVEEYNMLCGIRPQAYGQRGYGSSHSYRNQGSLNRANNMELSKNPYDLMEMGSQKSRN